MISRPDQHTAVRQVHTDNKPADRPLHPEKLRDFPANPIQRFEICESFLLLLHLPAHPVGHVRPDHPRHRQEIFRHLVIAGQHRFQHPIPRSQRLGANHHQLLRPFPPGHHILTGRKFPRRFQLRALRGRQLIRQILQQPFRAVHQSRLRLLPDGRRGFRVPPQRRQPQLALKFPEPQQISPNRVLEQPPQLRRGIPVIQRRQPGLDAVELREFRRRLPVGVEVFLLDLMVRDSRQTVRRCGHHGRHPPHAELIDVIRVEETDEQRTRRIPGHVAQEIQNDRAIQRHICARRDARHPAHRIIRRNHRVRHAAGRVHRRVNVPCHHRLPLAATHNLTGGNRTGAQRIRQLAGLHVIPGFINGLLRRKRLTGVRRFEENHRRRAEVECPRILRIRRHLHHRNVPLQTPRR